MRMAKTLLPVIAPIMIVVVSATGCGAKDSDEGITSPLTSEALNPIENDTSRTPCEKVDSYIRYAALWVDPKGGPAEREWDEIPGRVSEVEAIARIYASQVPAKARPLTAKLAELAAAVDAARDDAPAKRNAVLDNYRKVAADVRAACAVSRKGATHAGPGAIPPLPTWVPVHEQLAVATRRRTPDAIWQDRHR